MTILLAIGPAVIAIPLVLGGLALALRALFKKRNALPPDPTVATAPYLHMEAGTTTAHLERKGEMWQWSLAGAATTASSDSDASKAAFAMAETLAAAEEGHPITGSAGGPDSATYMFSVQPEGDDGWSWTITTPSKLPAIGDKPSPPTWVAGNTDSTRGAAAVRMLAALSKVLPWLDVQDPGGSPVGTGAPIVLPGLIISGNTVAVTDLATWVAHAAPVMRADIDEGRTADEIMDAAIANLPENATLSGKTIQDVRENVSELLAMLRDGKYVAVASPDEQLAAVLVGANLRPGNWTALEYKGHVILTRPAVAGAAGATHWEWLVWPGGVRGYDEDAHEGSLGPGKTRTQNERRAKQLVDQAVNAGGVWPGGGEAGGNQSDTVAPDYGGVSEGAFQAPPPKASEEAFMPPVKHIALSGATWQTAKQHDIEIFDFAKPQFHTWKHWRIGLGVCMRPTDTASPFGSLSVSLASDTDAIAMVCSDKHKNLACQTPVRLVNAHGQGGAIGPPPPVDWQRFIKPLLWKGQFDGWVHAGPVIRIDQFADVTGTGTGETIDPCEGDEARWPTPTNDDLGFYVQPVGAVDFKPWQPAPTVELITKGTKVLARIHYVGFPVFVKTSTKLFPDLAVVMHQAQPASTTKFTLDVQIWAAGTNEAP